MRAVPLVCAQVPFGACVEIDLIAELSATQIGGSR